MLSSLIPWLVGLALVLSAWALFNVYRGQKWIATMQEDLAVLQSPVGDAGAQSAAEALVAPPGLECVIRLVDPIRVAEQESKLAFTVTGIAPQLITREVYRQVREETVLLLEKRNIEADVSIRVR